MSRKIIAIGTFATLGLLACQVILGIEDESARDAGTSSDSSIGSSSSSSGEPVAPGCARDPKVTALPRENLRDASLGTSNVTYYFAAKQLNLRPINEAPFGFDLDGRYTTSEDTPYGRPACTNKGRNPLADDPGGIDNAVGRVVGIAFGSGDAGEDPLLRTLNEDFSEGKLSILLELSGYNGLADDSNVGLAIRGAPRTTGELRPQWLGADTWDYNGPPARPDVGFGLEQRISGYVRDYVLVVDVSSSGATTISLPFFSESLRFQRSVMEAKIIPANGAEPMRLEGVIAGTTNPFELFQSFYSARVGDPNQAPGSVPRPLCTQQFLIDSVCGGLTDNADIPPPCNAQDPFPAEPPPCRTISLALKFIAVAATLGAVRETARADAGCEPFDPDAGVCPRASDAGEEPAPIDSGDNAGQDASP